MFFRFHMWVISYSICLSLTYFTDYITLQVHGKILFFLMGSIHKILLWVCVHLCCSVVSDPLWPRGVFPARLLCPLNYPSKNTVVGRHSFVQGIFLTQGLNPGLLHCRWILHSLSHQGSPLFCVCVCVCMCMCITSFSYLFACSWTLRWLPYLGSYAAISIGVQVSF